MKRLGSRFAAFALVLVLLAGPTLAADIVLNAPGETVRASALEHPRVQAVVLDDGTVIDDGGSVVVLNCFVDTGASASLISHLNAEGYSGTSFWGEILSLGLDGTPPGEFIGEFTEIGVGGTETVDVTKLLGLKVRNGTARTVDSTNYATYAGEFVGFGEHNLMVRREAGPGEVFLYTFPNPLGGDDLVLDLSDPINILGTSVIGSSVTVIDPKPLDGFLALLQGTSLGEGDPSLVDPSMLTHILPPGHADIPATDIAFEVRMQSFVPDPPPAGEVLPTAGDNPLLQNVSIAYTNGGGTLELTEQEWLLDTGASNTFIGVEQARGLGIIPDGVSLDEFIAQHKAAGGIVLPLAGFGEEEIEAPQVTVDEIRIQIKGSDDEVVWRDVEILILDVAGLEGVSGMNMWVPAITFDPAVAAADPANIIAAVLDPSARYFDALVFDPQAGEFRVTLVPEPAAVAILLLGGSVLLIRRRRPT